MTTSCGFGSAPMPNTTSSSRRPTTPYNEPLKLSDPPRHGPCVRKDRAATARSLTHRYMDESQVLTSGERQESRWRLRVDVTSTRALLWIATVGRQVELRPEVHVFLYDRYWLLAQIHEKNGNVARARRLKRKAERHWRLSGYDGPPFAGALAMPVRRPGLRVRSTSVQRDSGDAA
jgi:hypothetical protein